jgi:hypothetical protein
MVIGIYLLYSIFQKQEYKRWWILLLVLLLIIFSRPVGVIFFVSLLIIFLIKLIKEKKHCLYFSLISIIIISLILFLQSSFTFYFNPDSLRRMEVICQVPETNAVTSYTEYNSAGLQSFFKVITNEIGLKNFLILGLKKVGSFFGMVRGFYSSSHNIIIVCTELILYPLAITGILFFKSRPASYLKLFLLIYLIITALGIFFTCDEWSNRFIVPILSVLIILAAMGAAFINSSILKYKLQNKNKS